MTYSRRQFVRIVPALGAFALPLPGAQTPGEDPVWPPAEPARGAPVDDAFPSLHLALAKEIVGVSHANIARVRELVQQHPALAKASFDWGYGDAETALGAASHVGRREIAEYLLEHGARMDIFAAAMLGEVEIVRAMLEAQPGLRDARGPHGIPLLAHAEAGGEHARDVVELLQRTPTTA